MALNNEDQPNILIESQNYSRDELGLLIRQNHYKKMLRALLYELSSTNKLTFDVVTIQETWLNENLQQLTILKITNWCANTNQQLKKGVAYVYTLQMA